MVRDPNDTTAPVVSFGSSVPYAVLTTPTAIVGTVSSSNLDSWTLEIATPEDPNFTVLATGQAPVSAGALAQLDPSTLANGFYQLLLTATDISGRTSQVQTEVEVNTASKPNDNVITDADLSVNLDGTTVLIQRTYDPLARDGTGDFGHGWILTGLETNLQTNLPATGQEGLGVYNPFGDGTAVYLTLPSGQRVKFSFAPTSFQVAGQTFYHPAWRAESGVTDTLQSTADVLIKAGGDYYDLSTGQPYNPADPFFSGPSYTLTAPGGTRYQLDAQGNAVGEITGAGVQLDISDAGITSSGGATIQFLRDTQGRITSILAPDGQLVNYRYDAQGDLVSMQDQTTGGSQQYGYDPSIPHLLTAAVRSNGNSVVMQPGTLTTAYIQRDLGGPAQFDGTTTNNTLAAGSTDRLAFEFDRAELSSTATGSVLLRVQVVGSDGLVPGTPAIAGLTPSSVNTRGTTVVALFPIDQPGLYVVAVSGATAATTGNYALNLTVAGDLNGDGNVDGNDSALLATAMGSSAGGANYSPAADINGDGKVDDQDAVIMASDYGFHATTASAAASPAQPAFNLDVNSATPPIGSGTTTDATVTLVGQTDPDLTVTLQPTGAVAQSNANGLFAFFDVPVADGGNTFTVVATNAAGVTSQSTRTITRVQPGLSLTPPVLSAGLADDTGVSALDNITSDDTVTGSITTVNPIVSFQAQIDQSPVVSVLGDLSGTTFTLTPSMMATINGGPLADGKHTLTLLATDSNGNLACAGHVELHPGHDPAGAGDAGAPGLE